MREPSFAAFLVEERNLANRLRDGAIAERDGAIAISTIILNSKIWKLTAPYRNSRNFFRKFNSK